MTILHDTGPLGVANHEATIDDLMDENVSGPDIQQVIGLAIRSTGPEISLIGKRWPPGNGRFFQDAGAEIPTKENLIRWIRELSSPGTNEDKDDGKLFPKTPLDITVEHRSLIFLTTNISNLFFSEHVIARKPNVNFDFLLSEGSVKVIRDMPDTDKTTAFWNSNYDPAKYHATPDGEQLAYNVLAEFVQDRNKSKLKLPIIIDPGTNNGGVDGWPT